MENILIFIIGVFIGATASILYFIKSFKSINNLLEDKLLVNDLLKQQVKNLQAKKSKKYYRRNIYKKSSAKSSKQ
tara:strand:+ start:178 stop:402 length:225 start_codon:yes stop_codon:yes gene_type:complete